MNADVQAKLKSMARHFLNSGSGDALDLFNLMVRVFEMRVDVQTKVVEIEKPVERIVEKIVTVGEDSCTKLHIEDEELLRLAPGTWVNKWRVSRGLRPWNFIKDGERQTREQHTARLRMHSIWHEHFVECAKLPMGGSYTVIKPLDAPRQTWVNRLSCALRNNNLTNDWKWSVRLQTNQDGAWCAVLTKRGEWFTANTKRKVDEGTSDISGGGAAVH